MGLFLLGIERDHRKKSKRRRLKVSGASNSVNSTSIKTKVHKVNGPVPVHTNPEHVGHHPLWVGQKKVQAWQRVSNQYCAKGLMWQEVTGQRHQNVPVGR